jgi:type IX secretion system PorP/SprF family membrane protein
MYRNIITLLIIFPLILLPGKAASQGNEIYRFNLMHPDLLNPAISGSAFHPQACLTFNKQWIGIPQSPQSMVASTSVRIGNFDFYNPKKLINTSKIKSREHVGLGLTLFGDRNGPVTTREINAAYAYHIPLDRAQLSMGISGSAEQRILDESIFQPTYGGDPLLSGSRESFMSYNASIGAYYYSREFFAGVAFHHIIPLEDKFFPGEKVKPDLILHGGYLFSSFGKPKMEISANLRYLDLDRVEYDIHFRAYIREIHWIALSYKTNSGVALHLGFNISDFYLGYTYETAISSMVRYHMGTHALHLGINLGMRRLTGI